MGRDLGGEGGAEIMSHCEFIQAGFEKSLAHVVEECGEVLAVAGKIGRFGPMSVNPLLPPEQQELNIVWLSREIFDLQEALHRLILEIPAEFMPVEPATGVAA
jgi:hypothetical protein